MPNIGGGVGISPVSLALFRECEELFCFLVWREKTARRRVWMIEVGGVVLKGCDGTTSLL
jgi:trehalose utilization protein